MNSYPHETPSTTRDSLRGSSLRRVMRHTAFVLIVAFSFVAAGFLVTGTHPARADGPSVKVAEDYDDEDGLTVIVYKDKDGYWALIIDKDGTVSYAELSSDPDGFATGGEGPSTEDLINELKKVWHGEAQVDWHVSVLGKILTDHDNGLVPIWNPADGAAFDADGYSGPGGGFDPEGGSLLEQLINAGRHHHGAGNDDGDGDGDDDTKPSVGGLWDDDMPGPPPLVNPNPLLRDPGPAEDVDISTLSSPNPTTKPE